MSINLTLIGQAITFLIFVWFTMKIVWPPLIQAMKERQKKIAEGLAAAALSQQELAQTETKIQQQLQEAKKQAAEIIEKAYRRADQIVEEAKDNARAEGERLLDAAQAEIVQSTARARESLRKEIVMLAINGAEQILQHSIDRTAHGVILSQLEKQMGDSTLARTIL